MKLASVLLAFVLAGGVPCFADGVTYYVATTGDDASSEAASTSAATSARRPPA